MYLIYHIRRKRMTTAVCLLMFLLLHDCAYFNTYYNADKYFNNAVKEFNALKDGKITASVGKKFDSAIEKSDKLLTKYPGSKWSDDAQYIIALSMYYKGDYITAKKKFEEFFLKYPKSNRLSDIEIWYSRNLWKMGDDEFAIHQLRKTIRTVRDDELQSEAYFTMADIFQTKGDLDSALFYLQKTTQIGSEYEITANAQFKIAEIYLQKNMIQEAISNLKKVSKFSPSAELKDKMQILLARIYRESGRYDEAIDLISTKLNDSQNEKIWGDLELQLALIYIAQRDYESALSRLSQINEKYKGKPVSAEAYYHLASLNMTHFHNYENAQSQFDMVGREDSKSPYLFEAKQISSDIKRYFAVKKNFTTSAEKVNQILKSLQGLDSLTIESINLDDKPQEIKKANETQMTAQKKLIDTLAIFSDYYQSLYEIAEIYYFNFQQPDSAILQYEKIVHSPLYNNMIDKSLYALYYTCSMENDTTTAEFYHQVLKEQFPNSPFLSFIENKQIVIPDTELEAGRLYELAEKKIDTKPDSAVSILKYINRNYPNTSYREKSGFTIAWLYHHKVFNIDSAMAWYQRFQNQYPKSANFKIAQTAYDNLDGILKSVAKSAQDTTSISIDNKSVPKQPEELMPREDEEENTPLPEQNPDILLDEESDLER